MAAEEAEGPITINQLLSASHSKRVVGHHLAIMQEAGLIKVSFLKADNDPYYNATVNRLTWAGYDFPDAARSEKIWRRAKEVTKEMGGAVSFEVFKNILVNLGNSAAQQLLQSGVL